MRRYLLILAGLLSLASPSAQAANSTVAAMTAASALGGTELLYVVQGGADRKGTPAQFATYIEGLISGDCTIVANAIVCTKTNGVAFGALATATPGTGVATAIGNALNGTAGLVGFSGALGTPTSGVATNLTGTAAGLTAGTVTTNANLTGDVTSVGNATTLTNAPVIAKVLTGYVSGAGTVSAADSILAAIQKINGNDALKAPLASPALTGTPTAPTATVGTNTTQLATTAFVLANGSGGAVSSVTAGCGLTITPTTGAVVASANVTATNNTGTTDTITSTACGTLVTENNAASVAVAITTAGFASGNYFTVKNLGAGIATYTPSSGTIDGAATLVCKQNQASDLYFDGTNYKTLSNTCGLGTASVANTGASGHTLPFLDGTNTFSGTQTFGSVFGTVTTQSGTTYTLAASDCGTEVVFTNAAAITVTIPAALTTGCNIAVLQTTSAGQVTVTGTAVSAATLHSAHSYTKTFGQWAIIGINIETTGVAILTGDGA